MDALEIIKKYQNYIKLNDFTGFYRIANLIDTLGDQVGEITEKFYEAGVLDDVLANMEYIPEKMFYGIYVKDLIIPSNIKEIKSFAFAYSKLSEINLPETIKSIDSDAFMCCSQLTEIKIPESVDTFDMRNVFWSCKNLETLWLPVKWRGKIRKNVIFGKWSPIPTTIKYY